MHDNYVETVRVVSEVSADNPTGYVTINKTDLTDAHTLYTGPDASVPAPAAEVVTEQAAPAAEPVGLSDNDPEATEQAAKKPWETA